MSEDISWITKFRTALFLVVIHSFIPMLILVAIITNIQRQDTEKVLDQEFDFLLSTAYTQLNDNVEQTRILLRTLSEVEEVRDLRDGACSNFLSRVLNGYRGYTNISVHNLQGVTVCSVLEEPPTGPVNILDRPYFQETLATRQFTVSRFITGRFTGSPILIFSQPIFDEQNEVSGIIVAGLDLSWMSQALTDSVLPEGTIIMLLDHDDTVVARYPNPDQWVGNSMADDGVVQNIHSQRTRRSEATGIGLDGRERVYKHSHIPAANDHLHVYVGFPTDFIAARTGQVLQQNVILVIIGTFAMILLVVIDWRIVTATTRLSKGKRIDD
jgi:C4-dicarboxylate-specific signal transduction histidine kinase